MKHSPAVSFLINLNSLSPSQVSQIPRSGPRNRLLKGDILSWLGPFTPIKHFYYFKYLPDFSKEQLSQIEKKLLQKSISTCQDRSGKYFTIIHSELDPDYYLKKNQVGILSIVKEFSTLRKQGDIIDQLSDTKKLVGVRVELVTSRPDLGEIIRF